MVSFLFLIVAVFWLSFMTVHANSDTTTTTSNSVNSNVFSTNHRVVVTDQAMGARCAVAADFDGDGRMDLVSASSNDNAVSWFHNDGFDADSGQLQFSIKQEISWASLGSRIVTVADLDGDGDVDVIGASYYDSSLRWFENIDGQGNFTSHLISSGVNEGQGVIVADLDNDGDPDIACASSGDNTIAVFKNLDHGKFCEIKEIVDDNAIGARTVVAADLNGDGWIDLASASKDDDTIAWYPNDGTGHFPTKIIISRGRESQGAYSLVAADMDQDGHLDLVVASNGNDHVSLWRNVDGTGRNFTKTLIFDKADFVLSVTAVDFDRDGDLDVASASFFDGYIRWYENVDGKGYEWKNHTVYVGIQGHYVSFADMDGDGDDDLIAVTHADNTVAVFLAQTECDFDIGDNNNNNVTRQSKQECCHTGTEWNGTACELCPYGTYGVGSGLEAKCEACPTNVCRISELNVMPATCFNITGCIDVEADVAQCVCDANQMKDKQSDACVACPEGQVRPDHGNLIRTMTTIGNYSLWEEEQGICHVKELADYTPVIVVVAVVAMLVLVALFLIWRRQNAQAKADALWTINSKELEIDNPPEVLGRGSFGLVLKGRYRGSAVAVKQAFPAPEKKSFRLLRNSSMDASNMSVLSATFDASANEQTGSVVQDSIALAKGKLQTKNDSANALSNKVMRQSFIKEMRTLSKLRHPCITTLMGAVLDNDRPLLVMEFMENGSLRDLLSNQTFPLDPEQTLPLIRDIMEGVRFLHKADPPIVHGDLKTANVLVDGGFRAKIADFGLSARVKAGMMAGTPFWMSPELLDGGASTTQSDVYAFGVLLWEVMTHKLPYQDMTIPAQEVLGQVQKGKLRPDCSQGLDQELVECMEHCWAQDPQQRPTLEDLEIKLVPLCGQNFYTVMQERHQVSSRQSNLLQDVFPAHIAKDLLAGKKVEPQHHDCVTIFFSDIVGFTTISSTLSAAEVSELLDRLYIGFDELAGKHGVFKLETIGDAWVGVTNLVQSQEDHAARIARFALDAVQAAQETPIHFDKPEMGNVKIRVGFHSGPVVSSVVGTRNPRFCLFGDTMNTASRMESTSTERKIQCSDVAAKLAKEQDDSL